MRTYVSKHLSRSLLVMSTNIESKTLIHNWVEERQCAEWEQGCRNPDGTTNTRIHREGHKGILSTSKGPPISDSDTTVRQSYVNPSDISPSIRATGQKQELLRRELYKTVSAQVDQEFHPPPPPMDYSSTTKADFSKDFAPIRVPPTMEHSVDKEQPLTYWNTNHQRVTGVSQCCSDDSPFHKNAAFSTPIEHSLDKPRPHDIPA